MTDNEDYDPIVPGSELDRVRTLLRHRDPDEKGTEEDDPIVLESELEKIRILLRKRETHKGEPETETLKQKRARRQRQAKSKGVKNPPPEI